jgi:hypothetical protein
MDTGSSSKTSEHLTNTLCKNPKEDHQLINNHHENLKTYEVKHET